GKRLQRRPQIVQTEHDCPPKCPAMPSELMPLPYRVVKWTALVETWSHTIRVLPD
ncbi:MAG: hypothetical protein JF615_00765, partial [Asticcacaulis sp.]|nr:hypothetical protein [Asticcacaulis sp.]